MNIKINILSILIFNISKMVPSIGFDFDGCLVNAYSIVPFIILLETLIPRALAKDTVFKDDAVFLQKSRLVFYQAVAENELATMGTIFRPAFLRILPKLLELKSQGKIQHLFIYSNNGISELIHVLDHILALTLQKAPYNVPVERLINNDGFLHVFTPRIHLDAPCRSVEVKDSHNFREKSLEGINACLPTPISETDLWYFDDTRYHTRLINQIKERYIVVEPYNVQLSNKRVATLFIESYPVNAFKPNTRLGSLILSGINRLLPGFRPSGYESRERLLEKLQKVLNIFSPDSGGKVFYPWKEDHINKDFKLIEQGLYGVMNPQAKETSLNKPLTYMNPIGGKRKKTKHSCRWTRKRQ